MPNTISDRAQAILDNEIARSREEYGLSAVTLSLLRYFFKMGYWTGQIDGVSKGAKIAQREFHKAFKEVS